MKTWEDIYLTLWKKSDSALDKMIEKSAIGYSIMGEDFIWNVAVLRKIDDTSILAIVKHVINDRVQYRFELLDFTECKDKELKECDIDGHVTIDNIIFNITFDKD